MLKPDAHIQDDYLVFILPIPIITKEYLNYDYYIPLIQLKGGKCTYPLFPKGHYISKDKITYLLTNCEENICEEQLTSESVQNITLVNIVCPKDFREVISEHSTWVYINSTSTLEDVCSQEQTLPRGTYITTDEECQKTDTVEEYFTNTDFVINLLDNTPIKFTNDKNKLDTSLKELNNKLPISIIHHNYANTIILIIIIVIFIILCTFVRYRKRKGTATKVQGEDSQRAEIPLTANIVITTDT